MRPWLTIALSVTALPAFAADPPVEGERTQAQAYCTHKSEVISKHIFMFSRAQNDSAARRKFNVYQEKAALRNSEATKDALQWLSDNEANVDREITKARRAGEQAAATLANNVAIEALANCQSDRIAHSVAPACSKPKGTQRSARLRTPSPDLLNPEVEPLTNHSLRFVVEQGVTDYELS